MEKSKAAEALEIAKEIAKNSQSATDFGNALFGINGRFGKMFPTEAERQAFVKTPEYKEIVRMRTDLRTKEKVAS